MNAVQYAQSNRIVELMRQPAQERNAEWVRAALQQAVLLELATLPPYLCGLWSVNTTSGPVRRTLRRIVFDEMSHLGIACNLLTTVDGTPLLTGEALVPTYPGPLPGGVRPGLTVFLSGLTTHSVTMYAAIEEPDHPLPPAQRAEASYTSIGAFYTAVLDALSAQPQLITGHRQVIRDMSHHGEGNSLDPLNTLDDVKAAIRVVKEQGEGTSATPENPFPDGDGSGELAHYYAFREILRAHELSDPPLGPDEWNFPTFPMGGVPAGGWPREDPTTPAVIELLDEFNRAYSGVLSLLEQAWKQVDAEQAAIRLDDAVTKMFELRSPARELMQTPLPHHGGKNYGPEFRYTDTF